MPVTPPEMFAELFYSGSFVTFSQSHMQAVVNPDDTGRGLCFELTRRWVHRVLEDGDAFDPVAFRTQYYGQTRAELTALINTHLARSRAWTYENYVVDGAEQQSLVRRRKRGWAPSVFRKVVLKNRDAVLEQVWAQPGVYLYSFAGAGSAGHMFGFEYVRDRRIRFFDSNDGLYEIPSASEDAREKFHRFYKVVWESKWMGNSYKKDARGNPNADRLRVLSRFELNEV
jgi:hypothetical protein